MDPILRVRSDEAIKAEQIPPIDEFRDEDELFAFYNQYVLLANNEKQQSGVVTFNQLQQMVKELYESLRDKSGDTNGKFFQITREDRFVNLCSSSIDFGTMSSLLQ